MKAVRRFHLFEFQDQGWLPRRLRASVIEVLQHQITGGRMYAPAVPVLRRAMEACRCRTIVDIGSGGGATAMQVQAMLAEAGWPVTLTMTDKYPDRGAIARTTLLGSSDTSYRPEPVDAARVPADLRGFRTFFTSFHHLRPAVAASVLKSAVDDGVPVGVFEFTRRSLANVAGMALSPLAVLPQLWTTGAPRGARRATAVPLGALAALVYAWDAAVSHLRTYTVGELEELAGAVDDGAFGWEAGQVGDGEYPITYLVGVPVRGSAAGPHDLGAERHHDEPSSTG